MEPRAPGHSVVEMLRVFAYAGALGWLSSACGGHTQREIMDEPSSAGSSTSGGVTTQPDPQSCEPASQSATRFRGANYLVAACGTVDPCPRVPNATLPLPSPIRLDIWPTTADRASVRIDGTGQGLVDGRTFDATIRDDVVSVDQRGVLSDACPQLFAISLTYDFRGRAGRQLDIELEQRADCSGNPGVYCTGGIHAELGDAQPVPRK